MKTDYQSTGLMTWHGRFELMVAVAGRTRHTDDIPRERQGEFDHRVFHKVCGSLGSHRQLPGKLEELCEFVLGDRDGGFHHASLVETNRHSVQ